MSEIREPALVEPLEKFLGYQLRRVSAASMAHLANAMSAQSLSPAAGTVLLMIEANPGETQARIGRALAIQRANIAPLIARLENDGLIDRTVSDGRSYGLACTPKGAAVAKTIRRIMANHEADLFGALSAGEQEQLLDLLIKARRAFATQGES
ncbi:MarR family winged helix-turn-helix transcriptional regulator [Hyphococcus sp.]|jgi:DNA-binding MarR family transcriptional regulator|uniref:MarR family winged helix-turn-helix transcriptional regulator n=1 Tax=Hyphococcus sp. TaxID=2038636 RepID=UPI003D0CC01B